MNTKIRIAQLEELEQLINRTNNWDQDKKNKILRLILKEHQRICIYGAETSNHSYWWIIALQIFNQQGGPYILVWLKAIHGMEGYLTVVPGMHKWNPTVQNKVIELLELGLALYRADLEYDKFDQDRIVPATYESYQLIANYFEQAKTLIKSQPRGKHLIKSIEDDLLD